MLPVQYNQQAIIQAEELEKALRVILMGTSFSSESELERYLNKLLIFRIKTEHYQIMYDAAQRRNNSVYEQEDAKRRVKSVLMDLMRDHFKGYDIVCFTDFSRVESESIHPRLQWGMWLKVIPMVKVQHMAQEGQGIEYLEKYDKLLSNAKKLLNG